MKKTILISKILASRHVACEIRSGVFLSSAADMIADQLAWDDEDPSKDIDFSTSPFWITTDDGATPIGIDDDAELLEMFSELLVVEKKSDYSDVNSMTGKFIYFKDHPIGDFPDDTISVSEKCLKRLLVNLRPEECVVFYKKGDV